MANTGTRERILSCAAVLFSVAAMLVYIAGLMCSHLSAFRVATNLRIALSRHIVTLPMGQIVPAAHPADASIELDHVTFRYDEGEKAKDALYAFDGVSGFCRRVSCVAGGTGAVGRSFAAAGIEGLRKQAVGLRVYALASMEAFSVLSDRTV